MDTDEENFEEMNYQTRGTSPALDTKESSHSVDSHIKSSQKVLNFEVIGSIGCTKVQENNKT